MKLFTRVQTISKFSVQFLHYMYTFAVSVPSIWVYLNGLILNIKYSGFIQRILISRFD